MIKLLKKLTPVCIIGVLTAAIVDSVFNRNFGFREFIISSCFTTVGVLLYHLFLCLIVKIKINK